MARKEAINTFTDGMVSDLNPLNTPNTVLTDCLNGTLITYDGNEFTLQNDKGNYPLKNCKLPENYIPVGVKEYGDILYIVSYNPVDNKVQVGSYPSPEQITDSLDKDLTKSVVSIWNGCEGWPNHAKRYTEIVEDANNSLQLFYGAPEEDYKLNPGDDYKVMTTDSIVGQFESVNFFIIDENRSLYNITSDILKYLNNGNENINFHKISWDVPGWLALQTKFAEIDEFKVNVNKLIVPTFSSNDNKISEFKLDVQIFTSDDLLINNTDSENCLTVYLNVKVDGNSVNNGGILVKLQKRNLKNGRYVYYGSYESNNPIGITNTSIIEVVAEARLYQKDPNVYSDAPYIWYDKYDKTLLFKVNQKGDVTDFVLGDRVWKYTTDKESISIEFDTSGLDESSVLESQVYLAYTLRKIINMNGNLAKVKKPNSEEFYDREVINDQWEVLGNSFLEIPFEEYTIENYSNNKDRAYPEDFYIIDFEFFLADAIDEYGKVKSDAIAVKSISKFIVASELMNDLPVSKYDDVYFDTWMDNYILHVKNRNIETDVEVEDFVPMEDSISTSYGYSKWLEDSGIRNYETFVKETVWENPEDRTKSLKNGFSIDYTASSNVKVKYWSDVTVPYGPLWEDLNTNIRININVEDKRHIVNINPNTGKCTVNNELPSDPVDLFKKIAKAGYKYSMVQEMEFRNIWNYDPKQINDGVSAHIKLLTANGIYNEGVDLGIGPYITISYLDKSQTYKYGTPRDYRYGIPLTMINDLSNCDALLVKLTMPKQIDGEKSAPRYNNLKFESDTVVYAEATVETEADPTYYIVFRLGKYAGEYKLGFIKIGTDSDDSAKEIFNTWANRMEHIVSDPLSEIYGGFVTADTNNIKTYFDNTISISTSGDLNVTTWQYFSHNMWSYSVRGHFNSVLEYWGIRTNNLKPISSASNTYSKINKIDLESTTNVLPIVLRLPDNFNELIEPYVNRIESRNRQIITEKANFSNSIYVNRDYNPSTEKYVYKEGIISPTYLAIADILNNKYMDNVLIRFHAYDEVREVGSLRPVSSFVNMGVVDDSLILL